MPRPSKAASRAWEAEFAALERDESVEKELEALKAKRAKPAAKPKAPKAEG